MTALAQDELGLDPQFYDQVNVWLARGDGLAVYENQDLGHPDMGHRQFVSYGSERAQIEQPVPPEQLPDIGGAINWRYRLVGTYKGAPLANDESIGKLGEWDNDA